MNDRFPPSRPGRRSVLAMLALTPVAGALAGCATGGSRQSPAAAPTGSAQAGNPFGVASDAPLEVVVFDGGYGQEYIKVPLDLYRKKHAAAKITQSATQQIQQSLQPRFVAGNPPDVVNNSGSNAIDYGALVGDKALLSLAPLLTAPSWSDPAVTVGDTLRPGVVQVGTHDGQFVVLNYSYGAYGAWYSTSLFEEKGWTYPQTWDDYLGLCDKMATAGIAPWTYPGQFPYYMFWWLASLIYKAAGPEVIDKINNLAPDAWTDDRAVAALRAFEAIPANGWVLKGSSGLNHTDAQMQFLNGKAGFVPGGSWLENEMGDSVPKGFDMAICRAPSIGKDDVKPFGSLCAKAGEPYVIPRSAANTAGGLEFLRAMLSTEGAENFIAKAGTLSSNRDAKPPKDAKHGLTSIDAALKEAGDNVFGITVDTRDSRLWKDIANLMGRFMNGDIKADQLAKQAQSLTDKARG
ncbi:carbohydrate ABC transporter, N-acetylglucosamine/diacetylchitobiose-binding protein [Spongiactinospora gelatinilytica]|uniref:Carbohydrate ABC transporter, N-acetylglucosamine/diacetylchitobiose-binding protein n=1 Tax=Spongiactinospora gelatinilytica TaxID=2666298 RepID=A0A2W2HNP0_9ACTN|nr:N-acetylglucosamine/diacetylchitobiose ABC transporter substrate-binding protein [Spongiactinospora gelatinilytica]PZG52070.1 carbohydrate ABC transporter, N-acetylglucosamine/diacetylchitobiose-binding protein [Spongiactinospora gelatinilytica]